MVVTKALTKAQDGGAQAEQRQWPGMVISGVDQVACTVCGPCPEDAAGRPCDTKAGWCAGDRNRRYWDRHPNVPLADTIPQYRGPGMAQSPTWRDHRSHCGICTLWRPVSQSASLPVWQPARLTRIRSNSPRQCLKEDQVARESPLNRAAIIATHAFGFVRSVDAHHLLVTIALEALTTLLRFMAAQGHEPHVVCEAVIAAHRQKEVVHTESFIFANVITIPQDKLI
ncbi:hypothetical protein JI435_442760 [Parastagonospora nodorum SN15]|uniref:Uncharacterized protein n=1 Tax=Phaeosphaeria nodorum (strain SN15 / ATCC MYA-4574 / FGSC 10173) TaxID=321614 RepID=A0A7U2I5D4_PHANO|nr:hypothetical protein JI435_442760 [Parastagonospora nodorum SN15]